ncbi:MAG: hypothetical protein ACHWZW_01160 [Spirulina sp.]
MKLRHLLFTSLTSLALVLTLTTGAPAQEGHSMMESSPAPTGQFQRIEQPLWSRLAVTSAGLGLIGLELWWFVFSKPNPPKTAATGK